MSFTKPEVVALMAKLDDMFEQVKTARAFRNSLEEDMIVQKGEKNYKEYRNADLAYRSVNHAYYDGIEELRKLLEASGLYTVARIIEIAKKWNILF